MVTAAIITFAVLLIGWLLAPATQPVEAAVELDLTPAEVPTAA